MHPFRCLRENGWWYTLNKTSYKLFHTPDPEKDPQWSEYRKNFVEKHHEEFTVVPMQQPAENIARESQTRSTEAYKREKPGINTFNYLENIIPTLQPIDKIIIKSSGKLRLNLVTDSLGSNSLAGGVATALIVASKFAQENNMDLRIITRNEPAIPTDYYQIMHLNNILPPENVTFFCDSLRDSNGKVNFKLEVSEDDVFFATSWWSAEAIRKTSIRKRFYYILQEIETYFYPRGGEHLLCSRVMSNPNIIFIVNSRFLWEYYSTNGYSAIMAQGCYFEPAFSSKLYNNLPAFLQQKKVKNCNRKKYSLFFYSRPNNPRNLFGYGLVILDEAIKRGILDTEDWEIYFAGQACPDYEFSDGYHAARLGKLSWEEYSKFLSKIDLTLSLMYTPHPSYPPYDAACCGSVVLTNKCENKTAMPECGNIILSDLDIEEFMQKLEEAISLSQNYSARKKNWEQNTISKDWNKNLENCLEYMRGWLQ